MKKKFGKLLIRIGARLLGQGYFVFNDGSIILPSPNVTVGISCVGGGGGGSGITRTEPLVYDKTKIGGGGKSGA